MISRTTQSLLAAVGVLAIAVGIAEVHPPTGQAAAPGRTVRTAVQHTSLVCPTPLQGTGSTVYTLAAPGVSSGAGTAAAASSGTAVLGALPATAPAPAASASASASKGPAGSAAGPAALAKLTKVGGGTTAKAAAGNKAAALLATADGSVAPGFTVQQTTTGPNKALSGTACGAPGTDFWFTGADALKSSVDYLELTNAESTVADVDVQIFGTDGEVDNAQAANISVPADGTSSLLLSTLLSPGAGSSYLSVHVLVRSGRVGAALHADSGGSSGADWLPATALGDSQIVPGLPGDLTDASLVLTVPGSADADLKVQLASQDGWITPAGHETVHAKSGMTTVVDLGALTHGQPAAMRLTPSDPTQPAPFSAGIRVVRGKSKTGQDVGYLAGSTPIGQRATAAGNTNGDSSLLLTSTGAAAVVKVSEIGADGTPTSQNVSIQAGATVSTVLKGPSGSYAVTVEPVSGGPVYAARMIGRTSGGVPNFTIQQLPDDRSTVQIPRALQDESILTP
ncbi:DUF5719 family protein [Streptacidiphilus cavernicola]|uniref:DUF5719 family protein n=1 Tax=Streptacidiphilus cavernicola TaxID=3342716 RepID=A0ABV6VT70_9ACTN